VVLGELPVAATELAAFLAGFLPWYMIPAEFFAVPALPLTPNGKLDREALGPEAVPLTAGGGDEPQGEVERQIAAVWREVLRRDAVNRDDSFFLIGGDSLLALQVCVRLERVFGRPVPAAVLFEHPTITALAQSFAVGPVGTTSGAVAQARARRARAENLRPAAERRRGFWFLPRGDGTSRRGGADEQG